MVDPYFRPYRVCRTQPQVGAWHKYVGYTILFRSTLTMESQQRNVDQHAAMHRTFFFAWIFMRIPPFCARRHCSNPAVFGYGADTNTTTPTCGYGRSTKCIYLCECAPMICACVMDAERLAADAWPVGKIRAHTIIASLGFCAIVYQSTRVHGGPKRPNTHIHISYATATSTHSKER